MSHKSFVWDYFEKNSGSETARCNECGDILSCKASSTSSLKGHLKSIHNISDEKQDQTVNKRVKSQNSLESFVKRQTLNEIVSRLAALDGLNIQQITKSSFIRESIKLRGMELPKSQNSVMKLVNASAEQKKNELSQHLIKHKSNKYSLTFDEWVGLSNRRYINVNVHDSVGNCLNLGMSRIFGSCTSKETERN